MKPEDFNPNEQAYPFAILQEASPGVFVDATSVKFTGQRGPISEVGINGCQIGAMVEFARRTIEVFNAKFPCRENDFAIAKLQAAEMWLRERTRNRTERGVEGTSQK